MDMKAANENAVLVEHYNESDRDGVWRVISEVWTEFGSGDSPERSPDLCGIKTAYQGGASGFWVARLNDQVIGTAALKDSGRGYATLKRMYVLAAYRGAPFRTGERLLSAFVEAARACGLRAIYLGTPHFLTRAQRFYEKHGFQSLQREQLLTGVLIDPIDTHFYGLDIS